MKTSHLYTVILATLLSICGCAVEEVGIAEQDFTPGPNCSADVPSPRPDCVGVTPSANACEAAAGAPVDSHPQTATEIIKET